MKPHLLKLVTDTICYTTLTDLKEEAINCIEEIKYHICHCLVCKKKYNFNELTSHECNNVGDFFDVNKKIISMASKKGSKLAKTSNNSKKVPKKGSKLAKTSKSSKKGSKLAKTSKSSKKGSKLAKTL